METTRAWNWPPATGLVSPARIRREKRVTGLKLPIITVDGLDCTIYDSVEDAELHLEPWLSDYASILVYDASGRRIELRSAATHVKLFLMSGAADQEGLRHALTEVLESIGGVKIDRSAPLNELIRRCREAGLEYRSKVD